jgi:hypothetical protein
MLLLRVPKQIRTFEHPRHSFDCRDVQRDDAMARLDLLTVWRSCSPAESSKGRRTGK